jgi:hypothetical protein
MKRRAFFSALLGTGAVTVTPTILGANSAQYETTGTALSGASPTIHMHVVPRCPQCGNFMCWTDHRASFGELSEVVCYSCNFRAMAPQSVPVR